MAIKQLSVFVDNKQGALADITDLLAKSSIDLRAMSIADTTDFGILRLIVDDTARAEAVLRETDAIAAVTEVTAVEINDRPGGLAHVLRILADHNINMEYLYAFTASSREHAYVVFRVQDNAQAEEILAQHNIHVLEESEVTHL